jgi:hypothetical protein
MPVASIAGVALAVAAAAVLLGGCTSSGTPSPTQSTGNNRPTSTGGVVTTAAPGPGGATGTGAGTGTATATGTAAGTAPGGGAGSSGGAGSASTCGGDQLSLSTSQVSAAGLFDYIVLAFANSGSSPCTVEGYPGAAAFGVTDSTAYLNATRQLTGNVGAQYTAPAPITLAPGASASTVLEWIYKPTDNHPYADCLRFGAGSFRITAPNTTRTLSISLPADVCSAILVHPLVPGATGRQAG